MRYVDGLTAQIQQHIPKVQVKDLGEVVPLELLVVAEAGVCCDFGEGQPQQPTEPPSITIRTTVDPPGQRGLHEPEQHRRHAPDHTVQKLPGNYVREHGSCKHVEECICCVD